MTVTAPKRWLTWHDLSTRWGVSTRHARTIAGNLGLSPVYLAAQTPRFPAAVVELAEKRRASSETFGGIK